MKRKMIDDDGLKIKLIRECIEARRNKWIADTDPKWAGYRAMAKMELFEILAVVDKIIAGDVSEVQDKDATE